VKKRLYDFSVGMAVVTLTAYALLLALFGYSYFTAARFKTLFGVLFVAFLVSFGFVFVYFVVLAPHLEKDGLHHGSKRIPRDDIACRTAYDLRFREGVIILRHRSIDYTELDAKAKKKKTVRVQATPANLKKLGDYLGRTLEAPAKPPRRHFFGRGK